MKNHSFVTALSALHIGQVFVIASVPESCIYTRLAPQWGWTGTA